MIRAKRTRSFIDLTGKRFGRLTVIEEAEQSTKRQVMWLCKCDCGNAKIARSGNLRCGYTKSCGCLSRELSSVRSTKNIKHGYARDGKMHPIYRAWADMINRCTKPKTKGYEYYGSRGIAVCERWLCSFENFLADMGEKPGPEYSIDRIDNDGNYEPGNCRWATRSEQMRNRRWNTPACQAQIKKMTEAALKKRRDEQELRP